MLKIKIIFLLLILILNSCDDPLDLNDRVNEEIQGIDLSFQTILQNQHNFEGNSQNRFVVFKSIEEQANLRSIYEVQTNSMDNSNNINYEEEMVIGIILEAQSSSSNFINIDSLVLEGNKIAVYSTLTKPLNGERAIGYPAHFIKLKKYDYDIEFKAINVIDFSDNKNINDTEWVLSKFVSNRTDYTESNASTFFQGQGEISLSEVQLKFISSNLFEGKVSCNKLNGTWSANSINSNIEIDFASTKIDCKGTQEIQQALKNSNIYYANDNTLILYSDDIINELHFVPTSSFHKETIQLESTSWKMEYWIDFSQNKRTDINGSYDFGPQVNLMDIIVNFDENNNFNCLENRKIYEGFYSQNANLIDFNIIEEFKDDTEFSKLFSESLTSSFQFEVIDDTLFIISNNDIMKKMAFSRYSYNEQLYGSLYDKWNLVSYVNIQLENNRVVEVTEDEQFTILFNKDGEFTGLSVCNEFDGKFLHGNSSIISYEQVNTLLNCPPSTKYMEAFNSAYNFIITDEKLYIVTTDLTYTQFIFERK
jgi:heat shock protein HslJ